MKRDLSHTGVRGGTTDRILGERNKKRDQRVRVGDELRQGLIVGLGSIWKEVQGGKKRMSKKKNGGFKVQSRIHDDPPGRGCRILMGSHPARGPQGVQIKKTKNG